MTKAVKTIFDKIDERIQYYVINVGHDPKHIILGQTQMNQVICTLFDLEEDEEELLEALNIDDKGIYYRNIKVITTNEQYFIGVTGA